jgi:hypothetical protein
MLNIDHVQIHCHNSNEKAKLKGVLESAPSLPWVEWILEHQVEIYANE